MDKPSSALSAAINRFEQAAIDVIFKGVLPPEEHAEIEMRYHRARKLLEQAAAREAANRERMQERQQIARQDRGEL